MRLNEKNGNGHGEYDPQVSYRYLDADVWIKKDEATGLETVAYTEDILAELFGEEDSPNEPDSSN